MNDHPGRMEVRRIETEGVGRLEPSLDEHWAKFDQLRWWAGVVHADTGLDIRVKASDYTRGGVPQRGYYDIVIPGLAAIGPCAYQQAGSVMTGISTGYRAAKCEGEDQ